ncbi:nucleotidyl transferase AbiEii/AbiGii toxin family protein [Brevibacterium senegalense]|uniref:nucleotidyl transferase AbiEii/AbiGii toxin family protein n=1 Tax=Brevibacterium senegalense TaxID=1033736 RepID=UPI0011CCD7C4|nr:nucleotidyl transferase AbiEii/AbiGii toxin family protein [Brevibacterium senegalense]
MIPANAITSWGVDHQWPTREQVEQDLLLSRALCAIADDSYLAGELVFRGGTALHKLHLEQPFRYSEDLDFVRRTAGGIAPLTQALTRLGTDLGFEVRTRLGVHPKILWRTTAESGVPLRIKIEVNTHERSPALPIMKRELTVDSSWWSGTALVATFQPVELVATKIRALYQRSKGRDLFDLWLALDHLQLDPDGILAAFEPYRPENMTATRAQLNLEQKLGDATFRRDLDPLVVQWPAGYDVNDAAELVSDTLLARLDSV